MFCGVFFSIFFQLFCFMFDLMPQRSYPSCLYPLKLLNYYYIKIILNSIKSPANKITFSSTPSRPDMRRSQPHIRAWICAWRIRKANRRSHGRGAEVRTRSRKWRQPRTNYQSATIRSGNYVNRIKIKLNRKWMTYLV